MHNIYETLISNISYAIKHSLLEFNSQNFGDECYTRQKDAEKEINKFKQYFKNKTIYCNCDNPYKSEIYKCLKHHFHEYGLKRLIATYLPLEDDDPQPYRYDYDGFEMTKTEIESGRFQDNADIFDEADIIISSPPFSNRMVRDYLIMCIESGLKFLFIGPLQLWRKRNLIDLFMRYAVMADDTVITRFNTPEGIKDFPCAWFTNFPLKREMLNTGKTFEETEQIYDDRNHYLIIPKQKDIPMDYNGVIGTSERFITKINPKQYKILGTINPIINGKMKNAKILIQKR